MCGEQAPPQCTKIRKLIIYKKFMTLLQKHYFLPFEQSEIARKTYMWVLWEWFFSVVSVVCECGECGVWVWWVWCVSVVCGVWVCNVWMWCVSVVCECGVGLWCVCVVCESVMCECGVCVIYECERDVWGWWVLVGKNWGVELKSKKWSTKNWSWIWSETKQIFEAKQNNRILDTLANCSVI